MQEAKRPRLTGSFSPASPPYHLAKGINHQQQGGFQQPQTPTSPPHLAASAMSSSAYSADGISTGTANTQLTVDTPTSSVAGVKREHEDDNTTGEDERQAKRVKVEDESERKDTHTRTDHERIQDGLKVIEGGGSFDDIQELLLDIDVGPLYSLREQPLQRPNPHPSQDLFDVYNLRPIASSVARIDPITGAKTNKLRKSYKGCFKDLGLAGKPQAVDGNGDFETVMRWPAEEWKMQRAGNDKAIGRGLGDDFMKELDKALRIPVPNAKLPPAEEQKWKKDVLGEDETPAAAASKPLLQAGLANGRPVNPEKLAGPTNGQRNMSINGRPKRKHAERGYGDDSYAGYGESYEDDGMEGSDDEALASRRKRVKA